MKFSYYLIKRLLPQVPPLKELAENLNLRSFEVEGVSPRIIDLNLSANRYSDAASHFGIVREAAAIFNLRFQNPAKAIINPPTDLGFLKVRIEEPRLCPRYAARCFTIKKYGTSPAWTQKILKDCGLKPINAVVDLLNYAMLETGQPLHAFDYDKLEARNREKKAKEILIRKARRGEKFETLDGQKFILDPEILVIADSKKALAIAGIKGGINSGIEKNTKRIIVEAANFEGTGIAKSSRRLKLDTDASLRFSHCISPALVDWGLNRSTELLLQEGAKLFDSVDFYPKPVGEELIEFDCEKYEKLVGAKIEPLAAKRIFSNLGFSIESPKKEVRGSKFLVRIPSWRTEVENFEDLVEEVSRLTGYEKLKAEPPLISIQPSQEEDSVLLKEKIRKTLTKFGLDEVYNHSFVSRKDLGIGLSSPPSRKSILVELENPISQDFEYLRPDLESGLLKNVIGNSRFFDSIRIFEIGKTFLKERGGLKEKLSLGLALGSISSPRQRKEQQLVSELKGIADDLLKSLGIAEFDFVEASGELRIESDNKILGILRTKNLGKGWFVALGEFDLERLMELAEVEREFRPLAKYPAIVRDISILVSAERRIGEITEAIEEANPKLAENIDLIDEYEDEKLGGRQSLTFRIIFQAEDRTLTDEEVNREMEKISNAVRKKFRAEIR